MPKLTASGFEQRTRAWEESQFALTAARSYPADREQDEPTCSLRTPFQRDRDRIVHCKSFRRLKHKTQVFISPEGDHYRTRLTHTLEACGISRTVARALRLNEDLTEAVSLGHDLGHAPFGHIGEEALDRCLQSLFGQGFRHNQQSLRLVERVERDGRGLNLTSQVRDGILNHTGDKKPSTLEGQIVRIVDRVAYINHDIDDALRAGIIAQKDLPKEDIEVLGASGSSRIDRLVHDLVETSAQHGEIAQSDEIGGAMLGLRDFMFKNVYLGQEAQAERLRILKLVETLFEHYCENPDQLPLVGDELSLCDRVTDYVSGMTDRYAIRVYKDLLVPQKFRF